MRHISLSPIPVGCLHQNLLERVTQEVAKASQDTPEALRLREAELEAEERRVKNFVEFIADGRGSRVLAEALNASEKRVMELGAEIKALGRGRELGFTVLPRE